jgi:hypothetical protein
MQKSNNYGRRFLALFAVITLPTMGIAPITSSGSQPASVAGEPGSDEVIPTGFKLERYARVWERNPFTLVTPVVGQSEGSVFDKLFLTSWLKDGGRDVVFIQNSETSEVQKITVAPNQDNFRLIALQLNPNPKLVEALISDGKMQGRVKFRLESQPAAGQTTSPIAQTTGARAGAPPSQTSSVPAQRIPGNPPAHTSDQPYNQPLLQRLGTGTQAIRAANGQRRTPVGRQSEANHLPTPQ